jgi:hypothetical protein
LASGCPPPHSDDLMAPSTTPARPRQVAPRALSSSKQAVEPPPSEIDAVLSPRARQVRFDYLTAKKGDDVGAAGDQPHPCEICSSGSAAVLCLLDPKAQRRTRIVSRTQSRSCGGFGSSGWPFMHSANTETGASDHEDRGTQGNSPPLLASLAPLRSSSHELICSGFQRDRCSSRTATAGHREGPWRGSCKQSPGPRNTNRIRGDQRRTRGLTRLKSESHPVPLCAIPRSTRGLCGAGSEPDQESVSG